MRIKIKSMSKLLAEAPDNPRKLMYYQYYCNPEDISKVAKQWHEVLATLITTTLDGRPYNIYLIYFPGSTLADSRLTVPEWWVEEIEED